MRPGTKLMSDMQRVRDEGKASARSGKPRGQDHAGSCKSLLLEIKWPRSVDPCSSTCSRGRTCLSVPPSGLAAQIATAECPRVGFAFVLQFGVRGLFSSASLCDAVAIAITSWA